MSRVTVGMRGIGKLAAHLDLPSVQDFSVLILNNNRGTLETTNAATGTTKGVEAELTWLAMKGLSFTASYTYTDVSLSQAFNPFTNTQAVVYPLYTPKTAGSISADYERALGVATLRAHVDANVVGGQYTSTTDPTLSDKSLIVNGRLALTDIRLPSSGADLQLSLWARNLTDETHVFLKNTNAILGVYGVYNEPRTLGVPRETIIEDYHLSTAYRRPEFEMPPLDPNASDPVVKLFAMYQKRPDAMVAEPLKTADGTPFLAGAFQEIDKTWGSVDAYLIQEVGLSRADILKLRRLYLE